MEGIQKTVHLGLLNLARKVGEGSYGENDEAFQAVSDHEAFMEDLQVQVIDVMN